jgi:hypothetical protein
MRLHTNPGQWRLAAALLLAAAALSAQEKRTNIEVESYKIDAKIDPAQQSLEAVAQVTFFVRDDRATTATFELNGALNLNSITDGTGRTLQAARSIQDFTARVNFLEPVAKDTKMTLTFNYGGRLGGEEESPIPGLKFAAIQREYAFLLYPSRWFPVSGYTWNRYLMELNVTVPEGYKVLSSGLDSLKDSTYTFKSLSKPGFPGSLAVVQGTHEKVMTEGITTEIYFRGERQKYAKAWGEDTAKVMNYLTSIFGVPPQANLTLVETASGAPGGYAAPGMLFISPSNIDAKPGPRLLANQITRQWFGLLISAVNRNHLWITNGMARYAEILYLAQLNGPSIMEPEIRDLYIDSLTATEAPVRQASRYEDYSPEFFAVTGGKGAAVYSMLRWVVGDEAFFKSLKTVCDQYAYKSISTDDLRKVFEAASGMNLEGFFIQWLESTGAPEFKMDYIIYRTQKGFRVMGKIQQDLDTFRMPVELRIETEGNPENKRVEVSGPSTNFSVDTFGKPKRVIIDPNDRILRLSPGMRVAVAIRKGEQFAEIGEYSEALKEYQKALEVNRLSSLAHYRVGEIFFLQGNYQTAANEFREALNGDLDPQWTEVWSHINLGKIFDVTQQRERAVNEYTLAIRTKDNTQGAQEEAAKYRQTPYKREVKN